jgi:hypothetical protein
MRPTIAGIRLVLAVAVFYVAAFNFTLLFFFLSPSSMNTNSTIRHQRHCAFRTYPPHRYYYHRHRLPSPPFLTDATYIRGALPSVLLEEGNPPPATKKICIERRQEEDEKGGDLHGSDGRLPYTDGFNPSIVPLSNFTTVLAQVSTPFAYYSQADSQHEFQESQSWLRDVRHIAFLRMGGSQVTVQLP